MNGTELLNGGPLLPPTLIILSSDDDDDINDNSTVIIKTIIMLVLPIQGTMKGLLPQQVKDAGASLILGNTYHLGTRPVSYATSLPTLLLHSLHLSVCVYLSMSLYWLAALYVSYLSMCFSVHVF